MTAAIRFPIRFEPWYRVLSSALFLRPADSYVEVDADDVVVRMGWGFNATFPRSSVTRTEPLASAPLSRGVHGLAGRWLVNGSGDNVLAIHLNPTQRARVVGFPVRLRELLVSVDDPTALAASLRGDGPAFRDAGE